MNAKKFLKNQILSKNAQFRNVKIMKNIPLPLEIIH